MITAYQIYGHSKSILPVSPHLTYLSLADQTLSVLAMLDNFVSNINYLKGAPHGHCGWRGF